MKAQPESLTVTLYIHAQKQFDGSYQYNAYAFKADPNAGLGFVVAEHTVDVPFKEPTQTDLFTLKLIFYVMNKKKS
ncbi:hypothetical protein [Proteus mirabilis]|uniref:hypothetical protein n=1 Tax=Proteus mirabilis TaxID=584 RepID=UPI001F49C984|nr:hypothetical protein [Proteus mirabilis]